MQPTAQTTTDKSPTEFRDVAPPGMEGVVQKLKGRAGISNPFAVAWAMHDKGYQAEGRDPDALIRRFESECQREGISVTGLGQLARVGVKGPTTASDVVPDFKIQNDKKKELGALIRGGEQNESRRFGWTATLREAALVADDSSGGSARVVLMTEGPGNRNDKNYYPAEALQRSVGVFDGKKCFLNHPSVDDERNRPERDVREICGWFSDPRIDQIEGKTAITAHLHFGTTDAGRDARKLVEDAIRYQQQFPVGDDVLVGFSINASGPSHEELVDGEAWNWVDGIEACLSTDLVTFPARGGKALQLLESDPQMFQGRVEVLQDLKTRAEEVDNTHDPEVIAALTQALNAFLNEELDEAIEAKSRAESAAAGDGGEDMQGHDEQVAARRAAAEADEFAKYAEMGDQPPEVTPEEIQRRQTAAETDSFAKYADDQLDEQEPPAEEKPKEEGNMASDRVLTCEACGAEMEMPEDKPAAQTEALSEARREVGVLREQLKESQKGKLTESERMELVQLRSESRDRKLRSMAATAIKEAKRDGAITVDELVAFSEAQWPFVLNRIVGGGVERNYGTGETPMPAGPRGRTQQSAKDVFRSALGR